MIVRVGQAIIDCFEAHTLGEHAIGLSRTPILDNGQGMVFVFSGEGGRTFHMPETMKFPLDIIFVNSAQKITALHENCSPGLGKRYSGQAQYVVEVPAGFCKQMNIAAGSQVAFEEEDDEKEAIMSSDILRTLSTASLTAQRSESTESDPYSREPSKAPNRPTERFMNHETNDNIVPEGGKLIIEGPIHDEEWNSPTRN